MAQQIKVVVGVGELIDKVTILEIKHARIHDPAKQKNISHELAELILAASLLPVRDDLPHLQAQLKQVNEKLWDIEDDIRRCEAKKQFDQVFIDLARAVYITNDQRCQIKRQINEVFDSEVVEEKGYEAY